MMHSLSLLQICAPSQANPASSWRQLASLAHSIRHDLHSGTLADPGSRHCIQAAHATRIYPIIIALGYAFHMKPTLYTRAADKLFSVAQCTEPQHRLQHDCKHCAPRWRYAAHFSAHSGQASPTRYGQPALLQLVQAPTSSYHARRLRF